MSSLSSVLNLIRSSSSDKGSNYYAPKGVDNSQSSSRKRLFCHFLESTVKLSTLLTNYLSCSAKQSAGSIGGLAAGGASSCQDKNDTRCLIEKEPSAV